MSFDPGNIRIVSVDGEGKTVSGRHAYVLLAAADDRGYRAYIEHDGSLRPAARHEGERFNGSQYHAADTAPNHGLSTRACLDFLLGIPQSNSDLLLSFAFTYDVTKILQDLPFAALKEFAELGVTVWEGYVISGIPRKYFEVIRGDKRVTVWDTFAYWQMSFVKALNSSLQLFDDYQREIVDQIAQMKAERAHFDVISDDEIREYCFHECEFLSILYRDFLRHCAEMGLIPARHSGPGALAEAFFTAQKLKRYMPTGNPHEFMAGLPVTVAIMSYFGGRFETAILGPAGDLIEYDKHSAYPGVAVTLPCLRHGRFRQVTEFVPGKWGFYYVGSRTSGPWAPFPFRATAETGRAYMNGASKGSIAFVHGGRRWVTSAEVAAAIKHFGAEAIPVYSGWVFEPECTEKPFAEILALYLRRKIGDPECPACLASPGRFCPVHPAPSEGLAMIIKLIINSVYGKLAQAIGWKLNPASPFGISAKESYRPPQFQCYMWAAWITGSVRADIFDAAMQGGESVVMTATDGILSKDEIPGLHVTDYELGTWGREEKANCWIGMPGIYVSGHTPDTKKYKRRGLDAKYFPAEHLREAWERGQWSVSHVGEPGCPECVRLRHGCPEHPIRAFMPLKLAVTRTNALDVLGEWIPMKKEVKFLSVQHKRNLPNDVDPFMPHDGSPIKLVPFTVPDDVRSAPYEPKQTWEDVYMGRIIERGYGRGDDPDIPMWSDVEDSPEAAE